MTTFKLRFVQAFTDRHGKTRHYFRRHGRRVALPGLPGSDAFMAAYAAALGAAPEPIGASRTKPGTINALAVAYYQSADFTTLAPLTQRHYRLEIDRWREKRGDLSVAGLQARHILKELDGLADRPGAQGNLRRVIRVLMRFAVERNWRPDNPTVGLRRPRRPAGGAASTGYRSWTEDDIAKFESHWPAGSRARLALHLLLYTAQRRQDVVTMGPQHVRGGSIRVVQLKGGARLTLPVHPTLAAELALAPKDHLTFLITQHGQPFSPAGFSNWFCDAAKAAGLPAHSSPHGLRKAALRRLAEAGASPHQIMAMSGHKQLKEVMTYTRAADQERLAEEAMEAIG